MPAQKTIPSETTLADALAKIEGPAKRADAERLAAMMAAATGEPAVIWVGGIVGFGRYHYRYDSGHEGDSCVVGFAARKPEFSIYLMGLYFPESEGAAKDLLGRLGKHRMGKACLYVKRLGDIDVAVLGELIALAVKTTRARYPSSA